MSKINTYPVVKPAVADKLIGTDVSSTGVDPNGETVNFLVDDLQLKETIENPQTGTSYTLILTDRGKMITVDNASPAVVTIPTNAAVAFAIGTTIVLCQIGTGGLTITAAAGVTINGVSGGSVVLSGRWTAVTLYKRNTNEWIALGAIV